MGPCDPETTRMSENPLTSVMMGHVGSRPLDSEGVDCFVLERVNSPLHARCCVSITCFYCSFTVKCMCAMAQFEEHQLLNHINAVAKPSAEDDCLPQ